VYRSTGILPVSPMGVSPVEENDEVRAKPAAPLPAGDGPATGLGISNAQFRVSGPQDAKIAF
jgi:hypothetical protein